MEYRVLFNKQDVTILPGADISVDGSRCPDKIAHIRSISFTLDRESILLKQSELSIGPLGMTHTT